MTAKDGGVAKVICNKVTTTCGKCFHAKPHKPLKDLYRIGKSTEWLESLCTENDGMCEWGPPFSICRCIVKDEAHGRGGK